jgi:RecA-family ATPase
MDMDFHIAAGRAWNGHDVLQGPVAYVAAEGGTGAYKRLLALRNYYGVDDVPLYLIPSQLDLLRPDPAGQTKRLIRALKTQEGAIGPPFAKIDTVAQVMPGGNENGPEDMGMIVHHFGKIRAATRAHLAGIHHTGHSEARRAMGHSSLKAAVDTEIEVFLRDKDTKAFDFTVTKQRDGEGNTRKTFALKTLHLGVSPRGKPVTSSVVIPQVTRVKDLSDEAKLMGAIEAALEAPSRSAILTSTA